MDTSGKGASSSGHGNRFPSSDRQAFVLFIYSALLFAASITVDARRAAPQYLGPKVAETRRALKATGTPSSQGLRYLSLNNARCMGTLIKNVWGSHDWDCKQRCTASTDCGAWSFTTKGWKCELHTACDQKQWDATYQSGVKVKPETPDIDPFSYKKLPNTHCYGQLIQRAWGTNQGQCRGRCTKDPLCRAFSHKARAFMCDLLTGCASSENSQMSYSEVKEAPADQSEASEIEDSGSSSEPEEPWEGCNGQGTGFREKDDYGCFNPVDGFYAKVSKNDVIGGVKYNGYWESCKRLCSAAAQGSIHPDDLECGRGHYMTHNKDTRSCYFYRPPSASSNGCSQWRSKDSDRLGMYCGPEGGSGSEEDKPPLSPSPSPPPAAGDSSDSEEDNPPPSPSPSPPPTGDSSDSEEDNPPPSPSPSPSPPTGDSSDSADEEVDYNRKYTGWVGESCGRGTREDTEIRTIDCEGLSGRDCEEMCISECNKDKDCEAFMTIFGFKCYLYNYCDVISIDAGCDDCVVRTCLENCPGDTKPYYVRRDSEQNCNSNNEISSFDTECGSGCERDEFENVRDDCAEKCSETPGCNEFFLPDDHSACELYTTCDLDYQDDVDDEGGYIGTFRQKINSGNNPDGGNDISDIDPAEDSDEDKKDSSDSDPVEDSDEDKKDSSDSDPVEDSDEDKDSSDSDPVEDSDEDKDSSDNIASNRRRADEGPMNSADEGRREGPWNGCGEFDEMGWIEQDNVGCINSKDGFFHKAEKGDVYNASDGIPEVTYDGTYQGCKNLCTSSLFGDIDYRVLNCDNGDYVTYSESSGSCYFYYSPGGNNGCDEFRPKSSDHTAMRCGFT